MPTSKPLEQLFATGKNCWRIENTRQFSVIVDAADYFRIARDAMVNARQQILLIGWDFDPRIKLDPEDVGDDVPNQLGHFILWLARQRPDLNIHILMWNMGAFKLLGRGRAALVAMRWARHVNITFKFDSAHPVGATHHQKIVVIDDALAFCGGIDMTADRWDTPAHCDDDRRRRRPGGQPYGPWHDLNAAVDGDAAKALGVLGRERWKRASGEVLPVPDGSDRNLWPERLQPLLRDVRVAISRTRPEQDDAKEIREIEAMYIDLIVSAKHYIYAENQYFASRLIAEAIAARLAEADPPEFILINPDTADGWLQEEAMGSARARLIEAIGKADHARRFRIYTPVTKGGEPIYVHAKLMIVDDVILRVGSANMNNRSLGLDSECDLAVDAGQRDDCREMIASLRDRLLAEHLGVEPTAIARLVNTTGSLIAAIEQLRGKGKTLRPFDPPKLNGVEEFIADTEILDPESPEEMFEPLADRGLFRRWRAAFKHRRAGRPRPAF